MFYQLKLFCLDIFEQPLALLAFESITHSAFTIMVFRLEEQYCQIQLGEVRQVFFV